MYENYKIYSPKGEFLFFCGENKYNWYLSKGLAVKIRDREASLTFYPKGNKLSNDPYYSSPKENLCVCCATSQNLTRHHVVPYWYRKYFPIEYKKHSSHDILLLCRECHSWYEIRFANVLKSEIASYYDVPFNSTESTNILKRHSLAKSIVNHADKMTASKREDILMELAILNGDFPSDEQLKYWATDAYKQEAKFCHGKAIVSRIKSIEELQAFVEMWRWDFVKNMNPKHLPKGWDVKRSIKE